YGGDVGIGDATPDGKLEVRQTGTGDIFNLYDGGINAFSVIDGGNVGINISNASESLEVGGNIYASGGDFYASINNGVLNCGGGVMTATVNYIGDTYSAPSNVSGDEDLYIQDGLQVDGTAYKPGGGSWTGTSDKRLKTNIVDYNDGLTEILQIKPVWYSYNQRSKMLDLTKRYVGVIAQDMLNIAPYMVEEKAYFQKIEEDENGVEHILDPGENFYTYESSALTYMLINAIKEQQAQIDELKKEIEKLKPQQEQK
ncbi:MAG TPA: tail fiber domain-containing protein, partial [Flavobacteriales bacterium]|nr:tail fiber domain-containing protein [Flavobacteriales bacterium]